MAELFESLIQGVATGFAHFVKSIQDQDEIAFFIA
jgi:hypothetical protein